MVVVPACTCLSRTWFWPRGVQSACVHINKRLGSACKEGQVEFYCGVIPHRAAARETLVGVAGSSWICVGV